MVLLLVATVGDAAEIVAGEPTAKAPARLPDEFVLPQIPEPLSDLPDSTGLRSRKAIGRIEVVGAASIEGKDLDEALLGFLGRIAHRDIVLDVRDAVADFYSSRDFVECRVADVRWRPESATLEVVVAERPLSAIRVVGARDRAATTIESAMATLIGRPVRLSEVADRLQAIRARRDVESVSVAWDSSRSSEELGLVVRVVPSPVAEARAAFDNYRTPLIGEFGGSAGLSITNVSGFGDYADIEYQGSEGLQDVQVTVGMQVHHSGSRVEFFTRQTQPEIVEDEFDALDLESDLETYGIRYIQPVWHSVETDMVLWGSLETVSGQTYLRDIPFSFESGAEDGESRLTAIRFGQDLVIRKPKYGLVMRSIFSAGLPVLGYTSNTADVADGRFLHWQGAVEGRVELSVAGAYLLSGLKAQLSISPLLSLEQVGIGGHSSVRGYRENVLVRDNAIVGAIDLRVPVISSPRGDVLEIATFFDASHGWNSKQNDYGPDTLMSVGVGLRLQVRKAFNATIEWAHALRDFDLGLDQTVQDRGIHFRLEFTWP